MADDAVDGEAVGGKPGGGGSAFPGDASPAAVVTASYVEHVPALPRRVVWTAARSSPRFPRRLLWPAARSFPRFPRQPWLWATIWRRHSPAPLTEGAQPGHSFKVSSHCKYEVQISLCSRSSDRSRNVSSFKFEI
jgi:hypothetical protein